VRPNFSSFLLVIFFFNITAFLNNPNPRTHLFRFVSEDAYDDEFFDRALARFVQYHSDDYAESSLVGIYVKDKFDYSITPQPSDNPAFVSSKPDAVTEFVLASRFGSIGLLAHNTLAGDHLDELDIGSKVILIYSDGISIEYTVNEVRSYQALDPSSPYSSFQSTSQPNQIISSDQLFMETYGVPDRLILQTCISNDDDDAWGRLFVIATKNY